MESKRIRVVALMMVSCWGMMISSCGSKGSSNEAVTRGARVNPVVSSGGSAISKPVAKGREIEVSPLVARVDEELERAGAYRYRTLGNIEGSINRVMAEGRYTRKELVGELEKALKEVEGYEEGVKKEILKEFFSRAYRHAKEEGKLEEIEKEMKGKNRRGEKEYGERHRGRKAHRYYERKVRELRDAKNVRDAAAREEMRRNRGRFKRKDTKVEFLQRKKEV